MDFVLKLVGTPRHGNFYQRARIISLESKILVLTFYHHERVHIKFLDNALFWEHCKINQKLMIFSIVVFFQNKQNFFGSAVIKMKQKQQKNK